MKKIFSFLAAVLMAGSVMAQYDTWSVVGSKAIMNGTADWAITETANDMATEDGITYTLTVTGKTLEVGTAYQYKIAKGHAWSNGEFPGQNAILTVSETAVYDIVYTANVSEKTHSAVATKAGEAGEITHVYSVVGSSADIFGTAWSETNTATDMTKGEGGIYSWTKDSVEFATDTIIKYKVVVDHAWGESYPSSDAKLVIAAGIYNIVFTFNPTDKAVNATATKLGDNPGPGPEPEPEPEPEPDPEPEPTINYYLAGSMNTPEWGSVAMPGDSIVLNLAAGEYGFKVQLAEGVWNGALTYDNVNAECSGEGLYTNGDRNVMFTLTEAGEVKIKVVEGEICVTGAFEAQEPTLPKVDLKGINNDWAGVTMVAADNKQTCSYTYTLTAGEYAFKIYVEGGTWLGNNGTMTRENSTGWVFEEGTSNCKLTADVNGDYVFTYTYETRKVSVTFPAVSPTGIDNIEAGKAVKVIENGQVIIIRDGVRYNAVGAKL